MKKGFKILIIILLSFMPVVINATSKAVVDITDMTVSELQKAVDDGYLTYELITRLYLERIEAYNKKYNAIISINEDAINLAKQKDTEFKKSGRTSEIFGMPVILKDNIDYKLLPTTAGTKALTDSYPNKNATIVQNLIDNGAIIIAKSNMSEFAFSAANSYSSYGHVYNAYNTKYTPYGSSGGSAVSVALSFAPLAIGTDTNSSIRLPSSAANIVGLRPTYGLLSASGIIKYDVTRDTAGPMTNTVKENATLLTYLADNGIDYTEYLKKDGLKDKTIGVMNDFIKKHNSSVGAMSAYYQDVNNLITSAIKVMEDNGAKIVYIDDFYNSNYDYTFDNTVLGISLCYQFNQYIKNTSSNIKSFSSLISTGKYVQALSGYNSNCNSDITKSSYYTNKKVKKDAFKEDVYELMDQYNVDVLLYPSSKSKILTLLESTSYPTNSPCYSIAPMTGMPAITIPMGFDSNSLPYGLELVAKQKGENVLYEIAYSYEQLTNNDKDPDVPGLYEIPESVNKLKKYYEEASYNKAMYKKDAYNSYYNTYLEVEDYLKNYNEKDEDYADTLLSKYEETLEILNKNKRLLYGKEYLYWVFSGIIILTIPMIFKKKKRRKN